MPVGSNLDSKDKPKNYSSNRLSVEFPGHQVQFLDEKSNTKADFVRTGLEILLKLSEKLERNHFKQIVDENSHISEKTLEKTFAKYLNNKEGWEVEEC